MLFFALEEQAIFKEIQTRRDSASTVSVTRFLEAGFGKAHSAQRWQNQRARQLSPLNVSVSQ